MFGTVAEAYASGRVEIPLEVVLEVGPPAGASALEIGAGGGQLTWALVEAGYDVTALEPNAAMRERGEARAPAARFVAATFEEFEADRRYDAVFSSNAFHWVDPDVAFHKAAELGDELVLIWNTPFLANGNLQRHVRDDVLGPRGSTFPSDEAGVRELVAGERRANIERFRESGRFGEPRTHVHERVLRYAPERYPDMIGSFGKIASHPGRPEILAQLRPVLGDDPLDVIDIVWVIAARAA